MDMENLAKELFPCFGEFQKGLIKKMQDVSQGEVPMLGFLMMENRECTPTELSEKLSLSTARIANTLNALEKKGLIRRVHDSNDRRKVFVSITKQGQTLSQERMKEAICDLQALLEDLGEEDAVAYVRLMKKVTKLVSQREKENK